VLVVEDDADVRALAVGLVSALGYTALQASDGPSALALLKARSDVDLLFTDMVMPGGMTGAELARAACKLHPRLAVVYTSGYTEAAVARSGDLDTSIELLSKPYRRQMLARALRTALDRRGLAADT
jgi:CheY-like chemotaxis protein